MPTRITERDLLSDDPDRYAAAMTKCQNAAATCGIDGFCLFDGDCFRDPKYCDACGQKLPKGEVGGE